MAQRQLKNPKRKAALSPSLTRLVNLDEKSAVLSREDPLLCGFLLKLPPYFGRCSSGSGTSDHFLIKSSSET
ncbi:hypothetical protein CEXT_659971 [Caerostris extrusa]|uniref:Uncharacterized protein n=1 Tax=Caerostris extrusa TaxID=172846 RepID=A0AAV4MI19_CAEEX|nr:hypothetical protein CEXT_659971 [Caerostris extrusa]